MKMKTKLIAIIFFLFIHFLYPVSGAHADPPVIGYTSRQLTLSGTQVLTASGGSGGPYNWSIVSGGGSLSNTTFDSTTLTAPAANPDCRNNPTIRVSDSSGQMSDTVRMSATNTSQEGLAYYLATTNNLGDECSWGLYKNAYGCGGEYSYSSPCDSCGCPMIGTCGDCYCEYYYVGSGGCWGNWSPWPDGFKCKTSSLQERCTAQNRCGSYSVDGASIPILCEGMTDIRTSLLKGAGCCPAALLTGGAGTGLGTNDIGGSGPQCSASPNVRSNSSANIKSGNLYFSQDAATLILTYNSIDQNNGPVGKKWTHNFNLKLTPLSDNSTLVLKGDDGNIIYFRLSGGVYYPEAISGDTSRIIKYSDNTYARTTRNGVIYLFDSSGSLTAITDRNSNTTMLAYSGNDLASITDPHGRTTTLTTIDGLITTIAGPGQRIYNLAYFNGMLASITDPRGDTWQYTYDADGKMLTKKYPPGDMVTYSYDTNGRLSTTADPDGKIITMHYDQTGITTVTEKDGGAWAYKYDTAFAVKTEKTDPMGNTTRYFYDMKRNLISTTAPDGSATRYIYDGNGNLTTIIDPLDHTTNYTYNSMNLVTSRTDPKGGVTFYGYDARGNLSNVTDPFGMATTFQYDAKGNVTRIIDAGGQTTTLTYDFQSNLTAITDPLGNSTGFTYDAAGNRLSMTDPLGHVTRYEYNGLNHLTQATDPLGNVTRYTHDHQGNVLSTTDAKTRTTRYEYNYRGQVTKITDAMNNLTRMSYGPTVCGSGCAGVEKLTALTDALNRSIQYTYDPAGRLVKETDPQTNETLYTYNAKGNLIARTKPDGKNITYTYDAAARLIRKQSSDGSTTLYLYDANGNMTYAGNATIAYNFIYDANNRLTGVTDSNAMTIRYQYDPAGNRTAMVTPENRTIAYTYNAARRLIAISTDNRVFNLDYDAAGRRTNLTFPNGAAATYTYDNNGNLTRLLHTGPSQAGLTEVHYTYDSVNHRISQTDNERAPVEPTGTETMSYGTVDELLSLNSTTYGYDSNGNRIRKGDSNGSTVYTYDDENRLVEVAITGEVPQVITYAYDPFGRRVKKNVGGMIIHYLYDRDDVMLEYDQTGTVITRYTHGPNIDEPLAVEKNGQTYYYHTDGLGSIIALTDSSGNVVQKIQYDAFGNIASGTTIVAQPYTYTAREYDPETGLYFYRARYFDPRTGTFITKDPILSPAGQNLMRCNGNNLAYQNSVPSFEELQKNPQNLHPYAYTRNNPINLADPQGLACGSGWSDPYIPEDFGAWNFYYPCQMHDNCYDTCGNPKAMCDYKFFIDMLTACSRMDWQLRDYGARCFAAATIYYGTVALTKAAQSAYADAQKAACSKCQK
jgi:RHS repeat-associated protein